MHFVGDAHFAVSIGQNEMSAQASHSRVRYECKCLAQQQRLLSFEESMLQT